MNYNEYSCYNKLQYLPVDRILPNPYQTRSGFDSSGIDSLVKSVKNYGVLQPIGVRLINKKVYELIFGERRLIACKKAGISTIPAIVTEVGDREAAALSMAENIHRKDLHYMETAKAVNILFKGFGYNTEEIADILSIALDEVEEYIKLEGFSSDVRNMLIREDISKDKAELLLKTNDSDIQKNVINKVREYKLNTEKTEIFINSALREKMIGSVEANHRNIKRKFTDLRLFTNTLKQAISLINESGMESSYEIEKNDDQYKISININV